MKACPRFTALAVRWGLQPAHRPEPCLQPAIVGLDPVVLVLAGLMCNAAGTGSLITFAKAGARSVTTSAGTSWTDNAAVKNVLAEAMSRRCDTYTSMTWPRWSTAR